MKSAGGARRSTAWLLLALAMVVAAPASSFARQPPFGSQTG